ncbi:hypothetical protein ACWGID_18955 [Kribbella sp. NPDC054772]
MDRTNAESRAGVEIWPFGYGRGVHLGHQMVLGPEILSDREQIMLERSRGPAPKEGQWNRFTMETEGGRVTGYTTVQRLTPKHLEGLPVPEDGKTRLTHQALHDEHGRPLLLQAGFISRENVTSAPRQRDSERILAQAAEAYREFRNVDIAGGKYGDPAPLQRSTAFTMDTGASPGASELGRFLQKDSQENSAAEAWAFGYGRGVHLGHQMVLGPEILSQRDQHVLIENRGPAPEEGEWKRFTIETEGGRLTGFTTTQRLTPKHLEGLPVPADGRTHLTHQALLDKHSRPLLLQAGFVTRENVTGPPDPRDTEWALAQAAEAYREFRKVDIAREPLVREATMQRSTAFTMHTGATPEASDLGRFLQQDSPLRNAGTSGSQPASSPTHRTGSRANGLDGRS